MKYKKKSGNNTMKKRLEYFDAMKGFGILSVIYVHLFTMGMRDGEYTSSITPFIQLYFMPLFFFVSGYFSAKIGNIQKAAELKPIVLKKTRNLLVPTIVMFTLCVLYFRMNYVDCIIDSFKGGYWFTYVLFCISILYAVLTIVLKPFSKSGGVLHLLIVLCLHYLSRHINVFAPIIKATSFDFIAAYYFYFYMGVLLKKYEENIGCYINNKYVLTVSLIIGLLPVFYDTPWYVKNVCRLILVYDILVVFRYYSSYFESQSVFAKGLRLIGRNTLEIYFLHYFFLFRIYGVDGLLTTLSNDYCFRGHSCSSLVELAIICPIAIGIAYVCIFVKKLIQPFPFAKQLCFGNN